MVTGPAPRDRESRDNHPRQVEVEREWKTVTNEPGEDARRWEDVVAALPESLNANEAALVLRMHLTTVRRLARNGHIPGTRLGSEWRFSKSELLKLLRVELDEDEDSSPPQS